MKKYKEYLEKAKKRYWAETTEDMLRYLQEEKEHLKLLKEALDNKAGLRVFDECQENIIMDVYTYDDNWEKILNLLIKSCKEDICCIKAIIYEQLENGQLFEGED